LPGGGRTGPVRPRRPGLVVHGRQGPAARSHTAVHARLRRPGRRPPGAGPPPGRSGAGGGRHRGESRPGPGRVRRLRRGHTVTPFVWGVGTSRFAKQPERPTVELAWEATIEALRDADVAAVDAIYVGSCYGEAGVAQRSLVGLGLTHAPVMTIENACASSSTA